MGFLAILKGITEAAKVGTTIWSGIKQNQETEEINRENRELADELRADAMRQQQFSNQIVSSNLALNKQQQAFTEKMYNQNRQDKLEETGYNRMQNAANKYADYLNSKVGLQGRTLAPIFNRASQ
jgi:hypothetical protein